MDKGCVDKKKKIKTNLQANLKMKLSLTIFALASAAAAKKTVRQSAFKAQSDKTPVQPGAECNANNICVNSADHPTWEYTCQAIEGGPDNQHSCQPKYYYEVGNVCKYGGQYNNRECAPGLQCVDDAPGSDKATCQQNPPPLPPRNPVQPGAECDANSICVNSDDHPIYWEYTCQAVEGGPNNQHSCQPKYYYEVGMVCKYGGQYNNRKCAPDMLCVDDAPGSDKGICVNKLY